MWLYLENQENTKYLTQGELASIFALIGSIRDLAMFDVMYKYGLRASEVGLLRIKDVKWERNRIKIWRLKGGISREYLLFSDTERHLRAYLNQRENMPEAPLFLSRNNMPISRKTIDWKFRRYAARADLPADRRHAHTLRHSIAVHMMDAGHTMEDVQFQLGHSSIKSTDRYAAISSRKQRYIFEQMERARAIVKLV